MHKGNEDFIAKWGTWVFLPWLSVQDLDAFQSCRELRGERKSTCWLSIPPPPTATMTYCATKLSLLIMSLSSDLAFINGACEQRLPRMWPLPFQVLYILLCIYVEDV